MKKALPVILWILTDLLLILSIVLFPSFFSVFAILAAAIFIPIEEWQNIINKYINKPIKSVIIAVCVAFVIAFFPFSEVIVGFNKLITDATPTQNSSIVYHEELSDQSSSDFYVVNPNNESEIPDDSDEFNIYEEQTESNNTESSNDYIVFNESSNYQNADSSNKNNTSVSSNTSSKQPSVNTSSNKPSTSVDSDKNNGSVVYRTPSGKRYHYSETCGGKNSYKVSLSDALDSNLTPCQKCVE